MKIGNWNLGWSRNVAIGVAWTTDGQVVIFLLGLTIAKNIPFKKKP